MRRFIIMEGKAKIIEVRSCPGIVNEYVLLPDGAIMPMEIWEELYPPEKPELESLPPRSSRALVHELAEAC